MPVASTLPMTTFGATTTAPTTVPGTTAAAGCEGRLQDCGGETEAPYGYNTETGKTAKLSCMSASVLSVPVNV